MLPERRWILPIGLAGAVFAAVHAYAFRVIIGELREPEDMRLRLTFLAANQTLFVVWVFAAVALWITLIALLPAIWRALGRSWPAGVAVGLLFVSAVLDLVGDGAQLPTLFLSARYAGAAADLRPGLEAGAREVSAAATAVLGPAIIPFFLGALVTAVVSLLRRPPGGRWYGAPLLLFALANVPVGPALGAAILNLVLFGAFVYMTERGLSREERAAPGV
jgi:hypothetical protein